MMYRFVSQKCQDKVSPFFEGDWNSKIATDAYEHSHDTVSKFGVSMTNARGLRLLKFA